jgi:sugar (pentulose or hexulose) kinase
VAWHEDLTRIRAWVGAADLLTATLCGEPFTDRTLAGRTGAFDQLTGRYDPDLLALAGIRAAQLPEPRGVGAARQVLPAGTRSSSPGTTTWSRLTLWVRASRATSRTRWARRKPS